MKKLLLLCLVILASCNQPETSIKITVEYDRPAFLFCSGPSQEWQGTKFDSFFSALVDAQPGDYVCNIQTENGNWVVSGENQQLYSVSINGYKLTEADIVPNGFGGANWNFRLNSDNSISSTSYKHH